MQFDSASQALIELAASRHNAFTTSEAAEIGVKQRRLRQSELRGELFRIYPKVWAFSSLPNSGRQRLHAASLALPWSAASHESAAWLHRWRQNSPPRPQLWAGPCSTARLRGADVRRFVRVDPELDLVKIDGTRSLSKAATLCVLGSISSPEMLERALDEFLRTEPERCLEETLSRLYTPKAPGPFALKQVIDDPRRVAGIAESHMERITAQLLSIDGMPPLVLQHELVAEGRRFRLDIACPDLMLGVEFHSRTFHWGRRKEEADNVRDLLIGSIGWKIIYVTHLQLDNPQELVRLFRLTAQSQARLLGGAAR